MNKPKKANIFLFLFLIYSLVLQIAIIFAAYIIGSAFGADYIIKFQYYITIFQDFLLILIPLIFYSIITGEKPSAYIPHKRLDLKNALYVILITIFSMPALLIAANIASLFFSTDANDTIEQLMGGMSMPTAFFALALMPAVFEETLCRGLILSNYKTTSPLVMYIISGLFFGILHLNFQQMSYAIVAGILFAFFVHYTNSIFSSILAHLFINGYQIILGKLLMNTMPAQAEIDTASVNAFSSISIASYGFLLIVIIIFFHIDYKLIKKFMARNKQNAEEYINNESGTDKKFIDIWFVLLIALFMVISITTELLSSL